MYARGLGRRAPHLCAPAALPVRGLVKHPGCDLDGISEFPAATGLHLTAKVWLITATGLGLRPRCGEPAHLQTYHSCGAIACQESFTRKEGAGIATAWPCEAVAPLAVTGMLSSARLLAGLGALQLGCD